MNRLVTLMMLSLLLLIMTAANASADTKAKAAQELFEFVLKKFGKEAVKDGAEVFSKRVATAAARHGEEAVFAAVRKTGPQALHAIEEAGEHGGKIARLITVHGENAIVYVARKPKALELLARHGEQAGTALCKHSAIAESLIDKLGQPAVQALAKVGPQSGRRLAIMEASGELAKIGRSEQLLGVIGTYGDKAASFVWAHKGALAVTAVLATFLENPEPYINGTLQLAEPIAQIPGKLVDDVAAPVVQAPAKAVATMAEDAGKRTNWTVILGLIATGGVAILMLRATRKHRFEPPQQHQEGVP